MKKVTTILSVFLIALLVSCGGKEEKKEKESIKLGSNRTETKAPVKKEVKEATADLSNKGIGPIKNLALAETIDDAMANTGEEVFKAKCTACHKATKKFIGPAPLGILERRSPEWVMNMILNPEEMTKDDPIAKALLLEYNMSPMANQNLTEEEARSILEYFRTITE